jgi:predicted nucleotidyltransferase
LQPTNYSQVNQLLADLLAQMQTILGTKLVGLYLYGSLVTGDYDTEISDVDLLAAVSSNLSATEFKALDKLHAAIVANDSQWDNRIEVAYLSLHGLRTFKTERNPITVISPGEPINTKDMGSDWLANWYMVQEKGITLFGQSPSTIIEPISKAEFVQCIKEHMAYRREWVRDARDRKGQAYAILTVCRGLYTCIHGEQVSKVQAAAWAQQALPEWSSLIEDALIWRKALDDDTIDHAATMPQTQQFVNIVIDKIFAS